MVCHEFVCLIWLGEMDPYSVLYRQEKKNGCDSFTVDMPMEVMDCIAKFILNRNFGHELSETNTQLSYRI